MIEVTLTAGVWYQIQNLDDPLFCFLQLDSTNTVICAFDVAEPLSVADVGIVLVEGVNSLPIPPNKSAWIKLISGAGSIIFSQYGGITSDQSKCAFAYTDSVAVDEVETAVDVVVGNDDSVSDQLAYVAFIETVPGNIAGAATVDSAVLQIRFGRIVPGQVLRVYGIAESSSQFATLTDYTSLASGLTLTTEFVDITVNYTGVQEVDITDLLQELVGVSGWDTASPIQLWVGCTSSVVTGEDTTVTILTGYRHCAVFAVVS